MAKVVLISPCDQFTLGVRTLSSVLKRAGHQCRIIVLNTVHHNRNPENLKVDRGYSGENASCSETEYALLSEVTRDFNPEVIGLSLASQSFGLCAWLTRNLKRDFPSIPILWGGVDPTLHPELGIQHADFLAVGEAEDSLLEFLDRLVEGGDPCRLDGFWANFGGRIYRNPPRPLIEDLDRLPFPDYDRDEKFVIEFNRITPLHRLWYVVMTQRGCPYRCAFCINSTLPGLLPGKRYVRRRSPNHVLNELIDIKKNYPKELSFVWFWDDIFTLNKKWLKEFAPLYRDRIGVPFTCYTYPGLCDDETAILLKKMGVSYVHFGIESGSKRVLEEVYGRKDPSTVLDTAQTLNRFGIPYRVDLIAANPFETEKDHRQTLELLLKLPRPFRVNPTNPLALYFNSPITKKARDEGIPLRKVEGANAYLACDDNEFKFWKSIFDLAQYPEVGREFLLEIVNNQELRKHPHIVEGFQAVLQRTYWSTPTAFTSHREMIETMASNDLSLKVKPKSSNRVGENEDGGGFFSDFRFILWPGWRKESS